MKYINNYETFFEKNLFNGLINWKNEKLKNAAISLIEKIKAKMDDPIMKKALSDLKIEYNKLPEVDKIKIQSFKNDSNIPTEILDLNESLLLEEESLTTRILHWVGLTISAASLISLILSIIKIAIDGNTYGKVFGVEMTTLVVVCMVSTLVFGLLSSIGQDEVNRKKLNTEEDEE